MPGTSLSTRRRTLHSMFSILLFTGFIMASPAVGVSTAAGQDAAHSSAVPTGDTRFDVVDRLAITNRLTAMAYGLDEKRLDLIIPMLAPEFTAEYRLPGKAPIQVVGRDNFAEVMSKRLSTLKSEGITRRHVFTPPYFIEQTPNSAHFLKQVVDCSVTNGENWRPIFSSLMEFRAIKRSGVWYFTEQIEIVDAPLEMPVDKLIPVTSEPLAKVKECPSTSSGRTDVGLRSFPSCRSW